MIAKPEKDGAAGPDERSARKPVPVELALQGGGSHGTVTWGVLDRVLEAPWIEVEAISGTWARAMKAAVFAHGMASGEREAARAALEDFWRRVSRAARLSPFQRTPMDRLTGKWTLDNSPAFIAWTSWPGWFPPIRRPARRLQPLREHRATLHGKPGRR